MGMRGKNEAWDISTTVCGDFWRFSNLDFLTSDVHGGTGPGHGNAEFSWAADADAFGPAYLHCR
jgi:hypothetical protein